MGPKAAFQSIKALVNATSYLTHDEGAPQGRHLGIQVLQSALADGLETCNNWKLLIKSDAANSFDAFLTCVVYV